MGSDVRSPPFMEVSCKGGGNQACKKRENIGARPSNIGGKKREKHEKNLPLELLSRAMGDILFRRKENTESGEI